MTLTQSPPYTGEQLHLVIDMMHHAPAFCMQGLWLVIRSRHLCD